MRDIGCLNMNSDYKETIITAVNKGSGLDEIYDVTVRFKTDGLRSRMVPSQVLYLGWRTKELTNSKTTQYASERGYILQRQAGI